MKVELTGLEIKTKDGTSKLTIDEAKELYRQLHELFGEKVIHVPSMPVIIDRFPTWPVYPPAPVWTKEPTYVDPPFPQWPTITCQGRTLDVQFQHDRSLLPSERSKGGIA